MKVIGRSAEGYLLAATERELANLFGFQWEGQNEFKKELKRQLGNESGRYGSGLIGLEIHAGDAYEQLSWFKSRQDEFAGLTRKLRELADHLDDHTPLFNAIAGDPKKDS